MDSLGTEGERERRRVRDRDTERRRARERDTKVYRRRQRVKERRERQ